MGAQGSDSSIKKLKRRTFLEVGGAVGLTARIAGLTSP
jgi:hypothetical protein